MLWLTPEHTTENIQPRGMSIAKKPKASFFYNEQDFMTWLLSENRVLSVNTEKREAYAHGRIRHSRRRVVDTEENRKTEISTKKVPHHQGPAWLAADTLHWEKPKRVWK